MKKSTWSNLRGFVLREKKVYKLVKSLYGCGHRIFNDTFPTKRRDSFLYFEKPFLKTVWSPHLFYFYFYF